MTERLIDAYTEKQFPSRRNIYITDNQWEKLKILAYANKWSVSKTIRHIVDEKIGEVIVSKHEGRENATQPNVEAH